MKPRTFIVVHGINRWTATPDWDEKLAHKIDSAPNTDKAFAFAWKGGPVRSPLFLEYNARLLGIHLDMMTGRDLRGVTHSYGAVIFRRSLELSNDYVQMKKVHLFAPACPHDLDKSGYAKLLRDRKIGQLHIYGSEDDIVLRKVHTRPWMRWAGYGSMGYLPPEIPRDLEDRVFLHYAPNRPHSWWPANLDGMYDEVTK